MAGGFINAEEKIDRIVGRRTNPPGGAISSRVSFRGTPSSESLTKLWWL
jgi:hypothetical protein